MRRETCHRSSGRRPGAARGLEAVYDQADQTMRVYGAGSQNGTVWGGSWTPASDFSGWTTLGGVLSGKSTAIYDPGDHNVEVYGHGEDNLAQEGSLSGETWTGWHNLGGAAIATRPIALYDPLDGAIEMWET